MNIIWVKAVSIICFDTTFFYFYGNMKSEILYSG